MANPYLGAVPSAVTSPDNDTQKKRILAATTNSMPSSNGTNVNINGVNSTTQTQTDPTASLPQSPGTAAATNVNTSGGFYGDGHGARTQEYIDNPNAAGPTGLQSEVAQLSADYTKALNAGILDPVTANEVNADASSGFIEGADNELAAATAGKGIYGVRQLTQKQRQLMAMMPGRGQLTARQSGGATNSGSVAPLVS